MSRFLETIAIIDKIPQHVESHQKRMEKCSLVQLNPFLNLIKVPTFRQYKLSILYNETQIEKFQLSPYSPSTINKFKVLIDNEIDYSLKYADRSRLEQLKSKAQMCDEVIIVKNGEVTDTSFSNLLFWDGVKWITPENPLLKGTCRERLLQNGIISSQKISVNQLGTFSKMMLINAMLDFDEDRAIPIDSKTFQFD
ncbi:MAG: branched-chain amino acid aminotransferase [Bacteroidetes bacterium]|nr:branched-chain amino acid aminotransferase [Bacteroidota bacterium]